MAITNIDPSTFQRLSRLSDGFMRASRLCYDYVKKQLVIKYMLGIPHELVGGEFFYAIRQVLERLPGHGFGSVAHLRASTFTVPGVRSKEGNQGLRPTTRKGPNAWLLRLVSPYVIACSLSLVALCRLDTRRAFRS